VARATLTVELDRPTCAIEGQEELGPVVESGAGGHSADAGAAP
jgi:hypothetical protein